MNSVHSFVSPNVSHFESQATEQWGDNFDVKLQYLVDSARENFQYKDSDPITKQEYDTSSPSSLHSFNSFGDDDLGSTTPSFTIQNGLPSPDILGEKYLKTSSLVQQRKSKPNNSEYFFNPVLTPIEPLSYDWKNINYEGDDLSTFSRVMKRTEDFQLTPATDDHTNTSFQGLFASQEIYPQVITSEIPSTPLSNPATSTLSSVTASPMTPGSAIIKKRKAERKKRVRTPKYKYDESAKPIAEQLMANKGIWNKISQKKKKGIYKCTHCSEMFKELIDLAKHIDENKIARQHKCPFEDCPWSIIGLPRRAEVRRHCAAQHAYVITYPDDKTECHEGYISSEKFKCQYDFCDRLFKRKDSQQRHEKLVHLNPTSRFNTRIDKLKTHYKTDDVAFLTDILGKKKKAKKSDEDVEDDD